MVNTIFLIRNVIFMAEDHHSCCFNLVKERVDGNIILMSHLQHGIHRNVHELQNSAMVLKSMSKGKAKKKDVKRKKYAMNSWSNQSNHYISFRLIRPTKSLTKVRSYLTKKYQYKDVCKPICIDVIRFT